LLTEVCANVERATGVRAADNVNEADNIQRGRQRTGLGTLFEHREVFEKRLQRT
jgi:hypothetical protein